MNKKEVIKKWEEILQDIENKKREIDRLFDEVKGNNIEQILIGVNQKEMVINNKFELIKNIFSEIEKKNTKIEEFKKETEELLEKSKKQEREINDFHSKQIERYLSLYKKIEEELEAGTTSVNLSKTFTDKVKEYKWSSRLWSGCFIVLLSFLLYYGYTTFTDDKIKTTSDIWRHLTFRAPFLIFGIWLSIFFGNRRAESKKLEELYKHKEVMARSFVGYKQTLEDLDDEDKVLLKQHMDNLLKAMSDNSASFLNTEGDKHPIFELVNSIFKSKKKEEE